MRGMIWLVVATLGILSPVVAQDTTDWSQGKTVGEGTQGEEVSGGGGAHEVHADTGKDDSNQVTTDESACQPTKVIYVTNNVKVAYCQPSRVLTVYRTGRPRRQYFSPTRYWVREVLRKERIAITKQMRNEIEDAVAPIRAQAQQALDTAEQAGGTANLALGEARTAQAGVNGLRKDFDKFREEKDTANAIWIVFGFVFLVAIVGFGLVLVSNNRPASSHT